MSARARQEHVVVVVVVEVGDQPRAVVSLEAEGMLHKLIISGISYGPPKMLVIPLEKALRAVSNSSPMLPSSLFPVKKGFVVSGSD